MSILGKIFKTRKPHQEKTQWWDRTALDETGAVYRLAVGGRGIGKTYSVCKTILTDYLTEGKRGAYIRRYEEEITPKNIAALFNPHRDLIIELSGGKYNDISYRAKEWHLCFTDDEGKIVEKDPTAFCIAAAINTWMTTKGQDRGEVSTILFDEFLIREQYLKDEFVDFMNVVSSLIRDRDGAVIYCLANTVSKYSPYWKEFGIEGVESMEQGEIRVYQYGESELTLAIEYCADVSATDKVASKYFAFDNPRLKMVSEGRWEILDYDRLPRGKKIFEEDIKYRFYIDFNGHLLCGKIVKDKTELFIFFHEQTKDIKIDSRTIIYTMKPTTELCHVHFLKDCPTPVHKMIKDLIMKKAVFVADNEVGEVFRTWCIETQGIKLW